MSLRQLGSSDADTMARWGDDPAFCQAAGWSTEATHGDRAAFFRRLVAEPPHDLMRLGAVADGGLVGYVDLRGADPEQRELGFVIGERARWGKGLGFSVAAAGCAFGFEILGLRMIWARTAADNLGSVAILRRLGMTEMKRTAEAHLCFSLTKAAWRTQSASHDAGRPSTLPAMSTVVEAKDRG